MPMGARINKKYPPNRNAELNRVLPTEANPAKKRNIFNISKPMLVSIKHVIILSE
jgi:hypothetical protein